MPLIEAKLWAGRTADQKALFAQKLIDATIEALNVPPRSVRVIIHEIPRENWVIGGEHAAAKP